MTAWGHAGPGSASSVQRESHAEPACPCGSQSSRFPGQRPPLGGGGEARLRGRAASSSAARGPCEGPALSVLRLGRQSVARDAGPSWACSEGGRGRSPSSGGPSCAESPHRKRLYHEGGSPLPSPPPNSLRALFIRGWRSRMPGQPGQRPGLCSLRNKRFRPVGAPRKRVLSSGTAASLPEGSKVGLGQTPHRSFPAEDTRAGRPGTCPGLRAGGRGTTVACGPPGSLGLPSTRSLGVQPGLLLLQTTATPTLLRRKAGGFPVVISPPPTHPWTDRPVAYPPCPRTSDSEMNLPALRVPTPQVNPPQKPLPPSLFTTLSGRVCMASKHPKRSPWASH